MRCVEKKNQTKIEDRNKSLVQLKLKPIFKSDEKIYGQYRVRKELLNDILLRKEILKNTNYYTHEKKDPDYAIIRHNYKDSKTFQMLDEKLEYCMCIRTADRLKRSIMTS